MSLMPITTKVLSLIPYHCEVYLVHLNLIKFVSDLSNIGGFL